jgi:DNA-binding MarR family transcriptional regulator/GNAT superfamily N-acetyltransferase
MTTRAAANDRIEIVRGFNRLYTKKLGLLHKGVLQSPFSLAEARVLFELASTNEPTATAVGEGLGLDAGYLSRILGNFERQGLLTRRPVAGDRRQSVLSLTSAGKQAFAGLDARSRDEIGAMLGALGRLDQARLIEAMRTIQSLIGERHVARAPYLLRAHRPGDAGWVVYRHGTLYAQEYGWDEQFEALVAGIVARFILRYDAKVERCWIAEREGENVGSVFLVKHTNRVAKLRLLLVEPAARGLGIGTRLIDECTQSARHAGYRKIILWTNSVLRDARRLYIKAGYKLLREQPHRSFGKDLVGETWELVL